MDPLLWVCALALLGLVLATVGFALLVRRRRMRHRQEQREREEAGVRGLTRIRAEDEARREAT